MNNIAEEQPDTCRKWQLTFNDPIPKGWTHERIKEVIGKFKNVVYWCMSDEIGKESNLFHTHLYIVFKNQIMWETMQNRFKGVHREMVIKGTSQQNRDYVFKEGKWLNDEKGETNIRDSHEEFGELPNERPGKRNDLDELYNMIKDGYSTYEILEYNPKYMTRINDIDRTRQLIHEQQFKDVWRNLEVTYIWGATGVGKTKYVMDKHKPSNVYKVDDYKHPFDGYRGQDVILFDEFRSDIKMGDMLKILDGYPLELSARYNNKVACFTKVYFCTNIDIRDQYCNIQQDEPETWKAFLRRINRVKYHVSMDNVIVMSTREYMDGMMRHFDNPFTALTAEDADGQMILGIESAQTKDGKDRYWCKGLCDNCHDTQCKYYEDKGEEHGENK